MTLPNVCVNDLSEVSGSLLPANREYVLTSLGPDCNVPNCSGNYQVKYKRQMYSGDPLACCVSSGKEQVIEGGTCDPQYTSASSLSCDPYMQSYCTAARILSDPSCQSWCSVNASRCATAKSNACDSPDAVANTEGCKEFCLKNPGMCDVGMTDYCKTTTGYTDPVCACIVSPVATKAKYNPLCIDTACISGGYATQSMVTSRGNGCQIIDCSTYLTLKDIKTVNMSDTNLSQQCGTGASTTASGIPDSAAGGGPLGSLWTWAQKNKLLAGALIALGGTALYYIFQPFAQQPPQQQQQPKVSWQSLKST